MARNYKKGNNPGVSGSKKGKGRGEKGKGIIIPWFLRLKMKLSGLGRRRKESGAQKRKEIVLKRYKKRVKEIKKKHPKVVEGIKDRETGFVYKRIDGKGVFLETDVDRLLDIVLKRGAVKASELARTFKVPKTKIEEWGIILEDHKLIDMHYSPFGEPRLMVRRVKGKGKGGKHEGD